MPRPSSLLAVLTPFEREHFFPEPLWTELTQVAPEFRLIDPTGLGADGFAKELATFNPEVLLACWQTPSLPGKLPSRLKYMCYVTGSVRRLVTRAQLEAGLQVTNWGGVISRMVAECALYHVLSGLRKGTRWTLMLHRDGGWRDGWEDAASLFQRRVGIHGFGGVAKEFVRLLQPFNCTVSVCAPDVDATVEQRYGVRRAHSLDALFSENDVIVEMAPLNEHTTGSVTERHLRLIHPGGVFVNVGRGAVVDEAALVRVAKEGKIYVGLDVFVEEPLPAQHGFRGLGNVSLTPHIAGPTLDRYVDAGVHALRNLHAYTAGAPLQSLITPPIYDAAT